MRKNRTEKRKLICKFDIDQVLWGNCSKDYINSDSRTLSDCKAHVDNAGNVIIYVYFNEFDLGKNLTKEKLENTVSYFYHIQEYVPLLLPCNCLTGLTINYLGYMITNCWRVDLECTLETSDNIQYVLSKYKGQKLVPVFPEEWNSRRYLGYAFVCSKESVFDDKIYIHLDSFQNVNELEKLIEQTEMLYEKRINEADIISEYMLPYLIAIRTQPIEVESNSLLAMALFLHPNRTLQMILNFLSGTTISENSQKKLGDFFVGYAEFLKELKIDTKIGYDYEFLSKFSNLFENWTKVYIGNWIEKIIKDKGEAFVSQVFCAACNRNREELERRNSYFKQIKTRLEVL